MLLMEQQEQNIFYMFLLMHIQPMQFMIRHLQVVFLVIQKAGGIVVRKSIHKLTITGCTF